MTDKPTPHPAKFSASIIEQMREVVMGTMACDVFDPFGGVGGIHALSGVIDTYCGEIEPEWANQSRGKGWTWVGDFFEFDPRYANFTRWHERGAGLTVDHLASPSYFDMVATSVTYGNRMADHHDAKDASRRMTYKHQLGRDLSPNNSGSLGWFSKGKYQDFHTRAYKKIYDDILWPQGGWFLLNVSNFVAKHEVVEASDWHRETAEAVGFQHIKTFDIPTPRMRYGANHAARVELDQLYINKKVLDTAPDTGVQSPS